MKTTPLILCATVALLALACDSTAAPAEPEAVEPTTEASGDEQAAADDRAVEAAPGDEEPESAPHDHAQANGGVGDMHGVAGMENVLEEGEYDPADVVAQPGANVGDITTCPVSDQVFTVTEDTAFIEHEGQNVYLCCARCVRRFQRDPETFLAGIGGQGGEGGGMVEVSAEGTEFDPPVEKSQIPTGAWICDMGTVHYARTDDTGEGCPLCGMRLTHWEH